MMESFSLKRISMNSFDTNLDENIALADLSFASAFEFLEWKIVAAVGNYQISPPKYKKSNLMQEIQNIVKLFNLVL